MPPSGVRFATARKNLLRSALVRTGPRNATLALAMTYRRFRRNAGARTASARCSPSCFMRQRCQ